ncbi:RNA pseudouridine synthase 3, mitochondrial isoform X2 [Ziziphus jujuba]|uniref:RNA pseudouridine synthase 3, mitochondrial isoform X2 n=1 Tax=Ziziphus jujuba TaxID=326968 RepID=A0A6P6GMH0_ZIZJJ|nr:RNA pseudouridine synthase 3, mitochondrial isoform X2 [Ziziphus jujuba]
MSPPLAGSSTTFMGLKMMSSNPISTRALWVHRECSNMGESIVEKEGQMKPMREVKPSEVMKVGDRVHVPVSVAESRISRRFDTIPSGTLYPNADEIKYLQRLVKYRDWAIIVLNKPPRLPVKGHLPIHNSMDALAAAALSYGYNEGPKLVHRLDRESSGLIIMGRTKESIDHLNWLFSNYKEVNTPHKAWNDACEATYQKYWALVIGSPKEKEGLICAPLSKVLLDDGKTERVILAHQSGFEPSQKAITEYRVLGPMINGCSWVELRPHTSRKHQLRVHCAEALGTPIVGDYKYGWFVHRRWKQMPRVDIEATTGKPYKLRRPDGLDVQKGSVLSKVPLLHLHCRELVLPNIAKFLKVFNGKSEYQSTEVSLERDVLRFVASMPSHMKISWNLMSSYLV